MKALSEAPGLRAMRTPEQPPDRTRWYSLLGIVGLAIVTFALFAGRPVQTTDEAWFLWVSHRVAHGDVLYRDVYSVTTPLSFWLSAAAVKLVGTQLLVVRALSVAGFVATLEMGRRLTARHGLGGTGQAMLVAAIFLFGSPVSHHIALYTGLAVTLAMAAWLCVASRGPMPSRGRLVLAGVLAGLSFQTKPNIGAFALLALAVTLLVANRPTRDGARPGADIAMVGASFLVATGAVVALVAATGGLRGYLDYVFLNKGSYVDVGVSYLDQLGDAVRLMTTTRTSVTLAGRVSSAVAVAPIAAVAALVAAFVRAPRPRVRLLEPAAFTVVGLASLFPRPTSTHIAGAVPLLIVGPLLAWRIGHRTERRVQWSRLAAGTAAAALVLGLGALLARSIEGLTGDHGSLRHLAAIPVAPRQAARLRSELGRLKAATGGRAFILKADAGYLYLVGDVSDPTPFDIPERSDFGPGDEGDAIRAIDRNGVRFACLHPDSGRRRSQRAPLSPLRVERYVRHHFRMRADLGTCLLYERT
jgi:hypothetical protein